jgi:hypothetical protein
MGQDLEMTKNGITVKVRVNTMFAGQFEATVGNDRLSAATWPELEKLVDRATRKVARTVDIPFTSIRSDSQSGGKLKITVRRGSAVGLHSGTGHVLAQYADGTKAQLTSWNDGGEKLRPLTEGEIAKYVSLLRVEEEAKRAVQDWEKERRIDLKDLVIEALNEGASPTE